MQRRKERRRRRENLLRAVNKRRERGVGIQQRAFLGQENESSCSGFCLGGNLRPKHFSDDNTKGQARRPKPPDGCVRSLRIVVF